MLKSTITSRIVLHRASQSFSHRLLCQVSIPRKVRSQAATKFCWPILRDFNHLPYIRKIDTWQRNMTRQAQSVKKYVHYIAFFPLTANWPLPTQFHIILKDHNSAEPHFSPDWFIWDMPGPKKFQFRLTCNVKRQPYKNFSSGWKHVCLVRMSLCPDWHWDMSASKKS